MAVGGKPTMRRLISEVERQGGHAEKTGSGQLKIYGPDNVRGVVVHWTPRSRENASKRLAKELGRIGLTEPEKGWI